ncbi:MAG TPA: FIST N-terminal domain-containing protein [Acidimicrobiales bacterium]|nr:FIST N-terminal domain-containing protein [Acidimicrobiales bacterium]
MAVGHSNAPDSYQAGRDATAAALQQRDAKLVIVFASVLHDLSRMLEGVNDVADGACVVGCTTQGEIAPGGPYDGSVVVAALGGAGFAVSTAAEPNVSGRQREAGELLAARAAADGDDPEHPHRVLILLTDGLTRDQEMIMRGAYSVLGASVPFFGGAAADAWRMQQTFQFHGRDVLSGAAVGAYLRSTSRLSISVGHGWSKVGEAMIVTAATRGRVDELDHGPALDAYLQRLGAPADVYTDEAAFREFALCRPVGVQRRSGEEVVNFSTEVRMEDRSLGGGISIPQGSVVWPMTGTRDAILAAVTRTCKDAVARLGGCAPIGYLTFSCAALRAVVGDDGIADEGARLTDHAQGLPYAGFYTYGEIARTRGIEGFHNQTLVVLALS